MSKDITMCSYALCPNTECERNIAHINWAAEERTAYSFAQFPDCPEWSKDEKTT